MDYRQENGFSVGNVVQVLGENSTENWGAIPATRVPESDKDYVMWNADSSINSNLTPNHEERSRSGSEPPNKRSRNSVSGDLIASNRAKAIGKMFYKTKLCCKFRAGTCPYVTNCNFAHSVEELRKPPPNWQEIVAAHEEERTEPREEFQIPILGVTDEPHRSHKGRHCKKFYTDEGCPYGDTCTFLHDEQSRARESVAISLGPGSGAGYGTGGSESTLKPSNWKTRICNKWELTGYCPFGSKCHFAHGSAELNRSGGGPSDPDFTDATASADAKQGSAAPINSVASSAASVPDLDGYRIGTASQPVMPKTGLPTAQKWNGPNKISKIYGDWIDDL